MSFRVSHGKGPVSGFVEYDSAEIERLVGKFAENVERQMEKAIVEILKRELRNTQSYIKNEVPPRQKGLSTKVADSLAIETLESADGEVHIRFGSDPMEEGGVEGSRGGKLALYLQHGAGRFDYGFKFMKIKNTAFRGGGEGFINARGEHATHPGFKRIAWLERTQQAALPDIQAAIVEALEKEWG